MARKKHAYLIMAHNEVKVFEVLVSLLDSDLNDLFIHIDAKVDKNPFIEIVKKNIKISEVFFIPSNNVTWGGLSLVRTQLDLLQAAVNSTETYSYYHYLSGVDLPLTNNEIRYNFFENNSGKEFIEIQTEPIDKKWEKRVKYYWIFEKESRRFLYKFFRHSFVVAQRLLRVNRLKNDKIKLQYGSNWVSITNRLATDILKRRLEIEVFFNRTHCPDEFVFQTFVNTYNKYNLYRDCNRNFSNVRYIDWINGSRSGSPANISDINLDELSHSNAMFARKFQSKDKDIIDVIKNKFNA